MVKKFRPNISNRLLYTLITIGILAILGVGVYAVAGTTPSPGHSLSQLQPCSDGETLVISSGGGWACRAFSMANLAPPSPCSTGQFLQWGGSSWICATPSQSNVSDTTAPQVYIVFPERWEVDDPISLFGRIPINATASDNVGVTAVQFKIDDVNLGSPVTSEPYLILWDTNTVTNGFHFISATATDAAGNSATSQRVKVSILNSACNFNSICEPASGEDSSCLDCVSAEGIAYSCNFNSYCEPQRGENSSCSDCPLSGYTYTNLGGGFVSNSSTVGIGGTGSFVAGVPILTPKGWVAVDKLNVGDSVYSLNTETLSLVPGEITKIYIHNAEGLLRVGLEDGRVFEVTEKHPFFDPTIDNYRQIGDFKVGDKVLVYTGSIPFPYSTKEVKITSIEPIPTTGYVPVYNLKVENLENYLANGVLVHNKMAYGDATEALELTGTGGLGGTICTTWDYTVGGAWLTHGSYCSGYW